MAEGIFKKMILNKKIDNIIVDSAGLSAVTGDPVTPEAVRAMSHIGIDISSHFSKQITVYDINDTDVFVCMTQSHKQALLSAGVENGKIFVLNITDPYMSDQQVYDRCAEEIQKKLDSIFDELIKL